MDGAWCECTLLLFERKTFHLITLLAISMAEVLVAIKILYFIVNIANNIDPDQLLPWEQADQGS